MEEGRWKRDDGCWVLDDGCLKIVEKKDEF